MAGRRRWRKKKSKRKPKDLVDADLLRILANPQRVRILAILSERIANPKEISVELGEAIDSVSYHLTVLRDHGLIELDRKKPWRGIAERFYRAVSRTLLGRMQWVKSRR